MELMDAVDTYIPEPERDNGQAVPDAGRGRILDHGPWYSSDGKSRERSAEGIGTK